MGRTLPLLLLLTTTCGGIAVIDDGAGGSQGLASGSSRAATSSANDVCSGLDFDQGVGVEVCSVPMGCSLRGSVDGAKTEVYCSAGRCDLVIDGEERCDCPVEQLEQSPLCIGGIPFCRAWRFDMADVRACAR